jgi:hypothetical protein
MLQPLLSTKLFAPFAKPNLINRPRLGGAAGAHAAHLLPAGPGGEPLGPREVEILRLLAHGAPTPRSRRNWS